MESWPEQENWVQMMLAVPRAEATQLFELPAKRIQRERALKASRLGHAFRAACRIDEGLELTVLAAGRAERVIEGRHGSAGRAERVIERRHGSAGASRATGGLGAISGPPVQ